MSEWLSIHTYTDKATNPRSSVNRKQKKHEETYVKARHKQVVLKPLTKRKISKAARKNTYTHIIYRGTKTGTILDLEIGARRQWSKVYRFWKGKCRIKQYYTLPRCHPPERQQWDFQMCENSKNIAYMEFLWVYYLLIKSTKRIIKTKHGNVKNIWTWLNV